MLLPSPHLLANSPSTYSLCNLYFSRRCTLSLSITSRHHLNIPSYLRILKLNFFRPHKFSFFRTHLADPFHLRAYESSEGTAAKKHDVGDVNFDSLLSQIEFSCLLSSAIISVGFAVNGIVAGSKKELFVAIGNRVVVWGFLMLVGGVLTGAWIRRWQWRRVCRETVKGRLEVNLLERIEKLEEYLRSTETIVRVLSRQLEKLGIRFRVTRKSLKEPITETAALVQKNSDAARVLSLQSDILEKELREIQKVLLAMQEQQRKQLDLILGIGKTGKLWQSKQETSEEQDTLETSNSVRLR